MYFLEYRSAVLSCKTNSSNCLLLSEKLMLFAGHRTHYAMLTLSALDFCCPKLLISKVDHRRIHRGKEFNNL